MSTRSRTPLRAALGIGTLFELVPDAVVVADVTTGSVVLWNDAAEQIFGWTADEAMGLALERLVAREFRAAHLAGVARYLREGPGDLVGTRRLAEVPAERRDGSRIWVEMRLAALGEPDERRFVVALVRDVTARRFAEAEAAVQAEHAERAAAAMREVVNAVSHDLRSPIAGIRAGLDLLLTRRDRLPAGRVEDVLAMVDRQARRAERLLADLLDIARSDAGRLKAATVDLRIPDALAAAVETAGVAGEVTTDVRTDRVQVDPDHFQRILVNLLTNAEKYGAPPLAVTARRDGAQVVVAVEDHGTGVAPEFRDRLFERFSRDDPANGQQGAGLGLAIVKALAEANDGNVGYEQDGTGSRFVVRLPAPG